ncbi:DUF4169 family protein [Planktotalea arctica]|uniref:DUF4169 family protein n=1 Tax=Planktotalea arctica TaxID=1481893 RepID=UPI000A16CF2F|nr:DUF4169 family protein [Planktotalea arctica]
MGKPVNLNRFRKQKARAEKSARADQNAVLNGLPKAAIARAKAQSDLEAKLLDAAKRYENDSD